MPMILFVEVIPKISDILPKKQKYDFCTKFRPNPKNVTNYQKKKKIRHPKNMMAVPFGFII